MSSTNWIFTTNNYNDEIERRIQETPCRYLFYGHEVAPTTGTPHLQGFIVFDTRRGFGAVKKLMPNSHVMIMNGNIKQNIDYCSKDATDLFEKGNRPQPKGQKEKANWATALTEARENGKVSDPRIAFIYHASIKKIHAEAKREKIVKLSDITELREWQTDVVDYILAPPHKREIYWIYDAIGGQGKTELARYLEEHHNAFTIQAAKVADMAHLLPEAPEIIIFDFTREIEGRVPYSFIESCKNGYVQATKYEGGIKKFPRPHVLIFSNFRPDRSKLSEDRWKIVNL